MGPTLGRLWFVLKLFWAVLGLFSAVLGLFSALDLGLSWSGSWSWAVLGCLDLTWAFLALFSAVLGMSGFMILHAIAPGLNKAFYGS